MIFYLSCTRFDAEALFSPAEFLKPLGINHCKFYMTGKNLDITLRLIMRKYASLRNFIKFCSFNGAEHLFIELIYLSQF